MSEIVRRTDYLPVSMTLRTSRAVARGVDQARGLAIVGTARELAVAEVFRTRLGAGSALTAQAVGAVSDLHHTITEVSRGDQFLEVTLREMEMRLARQAGRLIDDYLGRPL